VIVLLAIFYIFPVTIGLLGRVHAPDLAEPALADGLALMLPGRLVGGLLGDLLTALVIAGAFGAFLSTSSGLVVSLAGVISQELAGGSVRGFRRAALGSTIVPLLVVLMIEPSGLAGSVGLVFAFTASTLSPVLVLGVWWAGLTARGAMWGMACGATTCAAAIATATFRLPGSAEPLVASGGWVGPLLAQPAIWTVPLAVAVTVAVSRWGGGKAPAGVDRMLERLHVPDDDTER